MSLKEKIVADLTAAMKAGEKLRLETLRTLRAALMEREIALRGEGKPLTPEEETGVLTTAAKRRRESIEQFQKGGRTDLVEQETAELAIIQEYLPQALNPGELRAIVEEAVLQTGATGPADFGRVMPLVMKQAKGRADGRAVQEMVKQRLGG